jgi:hypothetical protein
MWDFVFCSKGRTLTDDVIEQRAENIWAEEKEVAEDWRRLHNKELHKFKLHQILGWSY